MSGQILGRKSLEQYRSNLIEVAIDCGALLFNVEKLFTLKSGRESPYFFNAGMMSTGQALTCIGQCYAAVIADASDARGIFFDVLFGPAYKGIPLAALVAENIYSQHRYDFPFAYNRKEVKGHGEGGEIVGASLDGKGVLIVDDVITAGTAVREAVDIIKRKGGTVAGLAVMLDRQEKGRKDGLDTDLSAVQEVSSTYSVPVLSMLTFNDLIEYVERTQPRSVTVAMQAYRDQYGVSG